MNVTLCDDNGSPLQQSGSTTVSITAQNTFSDPASLRGYFNVSVSGIAGGSVVTLQRSFDDAATWKDRKTYSADTDEVLQEPQAGILYRIGIKTGAYGSGTTLCRVST